MYYTATANPPVEPGIKVVPRPALFERFARGTRLTMVSAPPGSGKTILTRSWVDEAGLTEHVAWVPAERDGPRFWRSVIGALHRTTPGAALVQAPSAAADPDGWAVVERMLKDLAPLDEPLWLVIDDLHELDSGQTLRQLERLVMRATPQLRFVWAGRRDLGPGLHRLRLEGELTEIRAADLRFTRAEAQELLTAAGIELPAISVAMLHERTEGWATGLRLAALALDGHPEPERAAAEFSGSERTVAEYLLAEVLDRHDARVRRLLLHTSLAERVNEELAGLLTGNAGGERILQDLEQANTFVESLDAQRSWFRYHRMFADLLRWQLRREAPEQITGLHLACGDWFAGNGQPVEAIRHMQAARDWDQAARLLSDTWPYLHLDGRGVLAHELLARFPAELRAADATLATLAASAEPPRGPVEAAERYPVVAAPNRTHELQEPLSDSEIRVLRYLPTNLTVPQIAVELSVSRNTVKTHTRNLYIKLGTHSRTETVEQARALGLLAPSTHHH